MVAKMTSKTETRTCKEIAIAAHGKYESHAARDHARVSSISLSIVYTIRLRTVPIPRTRSASSLSEPVYSKCHATASISRLARMPPSHRRRHRHIPDYRTPRRPCRSQVLGRSAFVAICDHRVPRPKCYSGFATGRFAYRDLQSRYRWSPTRRVFV